MQAARSCGIWWRVWPAGALYACWMAEIDLTSTSVTWLWDRPWGGRTAELPAVLERIRLSRAFTCYQLVALLKGTPAEPVPTLVLDLLSTFYDENVSTEESLRLLQECVAHLRRLNRLAPVAVSIRPGPPESRPELLNTMLEAASQVWTLEPHIPKPPPRLL